MSGGAFDYKQQLIEMIADDIEQKIIEAGREIPEEVLKKEWYGYGYDYYHAKRTLKETYPDYTRQTIAIMKRAVYVLRMAYIYVQRIDWMLSGDDGEEDLVERLKEELDELRTKYPSGRFTFDRKKVRYDEDYGHFREINEE